MLIFRVFPTHHQTMVGGTLNNGLSSTNDQYEFARKTMIAAHHCFLPFTAILLCEHLITAQKHVRGSRRSPSRSMDSLRHCWCGLWIQIRMMTYAMMIQVCLVIYSPSKPVTFDNRQCDLQSSKHSKRLHQESSLKATKRQQNIYMATFVTVCAAGMLLCLTSKRVEVQISL